MVEVSLCGLTQYFIFQVLECPTHPQLEFTVISGCEAGRNFGVAATIVRREESSSQFKAGSRKRPPNDLSLGFSVSRKFGFLNSGRPQTHVKSDTRMKIINWRQNSADR